LTGSGIVSVAAWSHTGQVSITSNSAIGRSVAHPNGLTGHTPQVQNRFMRRVLAVALISFLAMAVATAAWADCVGEQPNAHARMKCCATAHHTCGKGNADDCCNKMNDAGPSSAVSTSAAQPVHVPVVFAVLHSLATTYVTLRSAARVVATLIRPHDPPHLHTFPLLI
jgi:hypothetical protein